MKLRRPDRVEMLMLACVALMIAAIASAVVYDAHHPCIRESEDLRMHFIQSGKVLVPIWTHECLERAP